MRRGLFGGGITLRWCVVCMGLLLSGCGGVRRTVAPELMIREEVRPIRVPGDTAVVRYRLSAPVSLESLSSSGQGVDVQASVEEDVLTVHARSEPKEVPVPYVVVREVSAQGVAGLPGGVVAVALIALVAQAVWGVVLLFRK